MEWEQIYAELLNKIRWSVASTAANIPVNYSYQDSIALSKVLAGDALKLMKAREEKPDLRFTTESVREAIRSEG